MIIAIAEELHSCNSYFVCSFLFHFHSTLLFRSFDRADTKTHFYAPFFCMHHLWIHAKNGTGLTQTAHLPVIIVAGVVI